jgi:hypothetical protein
MIHFLLIIICISISQFAFSETSFENKSEPTNTYSNTSEIELLKKKVRELEEVQNENSEIIKKQLADQHFDQNSRGYIELKLGKSLFNPKDIEDVNDDTFGGAENADWEEFGHATILDFEIGKTILSDDYSKDEFGIGYQHLSSEAEASYDPVGGGSTITVYEKIAVHTLFARYARLFNISSSGKLNIGPGLTLGYSPVSKMTIQFEQGNEGAQLAAESTSYLIELFFKGKLEVSKYFSLVATGGYRIQEAENLRLNAADLISVKTKVDLDSSGFFGTLGLSVSF